MSIEYVKSAQHIATEREGPDVVRVAGVVIALLARTKTKNLAELNDRVRAHDDDVLAALSRTKLTRWQLSAIDYFSPLLSRVQAAPLIHIAYCTSCGGHAYVSAASKPGKDSRCKLSRGCGEKTVFISKKATLLPKDRHPDSSEHRRYGIETLSEGADAAENEWSVKNDSDGSSIDDDDEAQPSEAVDSEDPDVPFDLDDFG